MMRYALSILIVVLIIVLCGLLKMCVKKTLSPLGAFTKATYDRTLGWAGLQEKTNESGDYVRHFFSSVKWGVISWLLFMLIILGIFSVLDIFHIGTMSIDILDKAIK